MRLFRTLWFRIKFVRSDYFFFNGHASYCVNNIEEIDRKKTWLKSEKMHTVYDILIAAILLRFYRRSNDSFSSRSALADPMNETFSNRNVCSLVRLRNNSSLHRYFTLLAHIINSNIIKFWMVFRCAYHVSEVVSLVERCYQRASLFHLSYCTFCTVAIFKCI